MVPRRRKDKGESHGSVPVELLDVEDPVWRSSRSTAVWFRSQGLELRRHPEWWGPLSFHHEAVVRWAVANGWASERFPKFPDWGRLREAGVPQSGSRFAWMNLVRIE